MAQQPTFSGAPRPCGSAVEGTPFDAAVNYASDFWQRSVIFLDILRQNGNQQAEMTSKPINAVLIYEYEVILKGTDLAAALSRRAHRMPVLLAGR